MIRYIMSFSVPEGKQQAAQKAIDSYFNDLYKHGPGGMRSQCYSDNDDECIFVHLKSFKKEAVANQHFKSLPFKEYIRELSALCDSYPAFSRLQQENTFESIY